MTMEEKKNQQFNGRHETLNLEGPPDFPKGGACVSYPTDWFFPEPPLGKVELEKINNAKSICAKCSIQMDCLTYAMEWEPFGIWGGMTESQRKFLRQKMNFKTRRYDETVRLQQLMST